MSTLLTHPMTAEEFATLPKGNLRRELVKGEIVETMSPGGEHSLITVKTSALLWLWSKAHGGFVGAEAGYVLSRNPETVRIADISYIQPLRVPATGVPKGYWQQPPDLAIEIVSPNEAATEVQGKVNDYLAAGTAMVWVIYPDSQQIAVYRTNGVFHLYSRGDTLTFPDLLPGFSCTVAELFEL